MELSLGVPLDKQARQQTMLPGALGGLALPLPTLERAAAAFLSTHTTHAATVQQASEQLGKPWHGDRDEVAAKEAA